MTDLKICAMCRMSKPLGCFYGSTRSDRRDSYCKDCRKQLSAKAYHEDPSRRILQAQEWAAANPLRVLLKNARGSCKARAYRGRTGQTFDLIYDHLLDLYEQQNGRCYWTGLPLVIDGKPKNRLMQISLDRLDSSLGYTPGNVVLCTLAANLLRNDATFDETLCFWSALGVEDTPSQETDAAIG